MNIEDKRARERAKESAAKVPAGKRKAGGRLVENAATQGWKAALNQLQVVYADRINPYL